MSGVAACLVLAACGDAESDDQATETSAEEADDGAETTPEQEAGEAEPAAVAGANPEECARLVGVDDETIVVGLMMGLSGPFGAYAEAISDGLMGYVERINNEGGIDGRQIEMRRVDHEYDQAVALSHVERLQGDISILVSHGTAPTNAVLPDTLANCIPLLILGQGGVNALEPHATIYSTPNAYMTLNAMEWALNEWGADAPWGIVYQSDVAGEEMRRAAEFGAEFLGIDMPVQESFDLGDGDFSAQVNALRDADVETVILAAYPPDCFQIAAQAVAQGLDLNWAGPAVCWGGEVAFPDEDSRTLVEDIGLVQASYTSGWQSSDDPLLAQAREDIAAVSDRAGQVPLLGYSGGFLLAEILQRAADSGDLSRGGIINVIPEVGEQDMSDLFCGVSLGEAGQPSNPSRGSMILRISSDAEPDGYVLEEGCFVGSAAEEFQLSSLVD